MSRVIALLLAIILSSTTIAIAKSSTWAISQSPVPVELRETNVECKREEANSPQYLPFIIHNERAYYSGPWETEPNTPYTLANGPIGSGQEYYGYPDDLRDYWSFYATSDGPMSISLENFSANGGQLQLFYQVATETTRVAYDITAPYQINYSGPAGLYYIFIAAESGPNTLTPYTLTAQFPSAKINEGEHDADEFRSTRQLQWIGYDFETGTENWTTSEGEYKLAELDTSQDVVCVGNQSLELTTELYISQDHVTRHTEAVAYFSNAIPGGMDGPGPYDLEGKEVSCNVFLPSELISEGDPQAYARLFVKDVNFANQYGEAMDVTPLTADTWQQLSILVGQGEGMFDPTKVNALGVRFELQEGATLDFEGQIYIDGCEIEP
jgi:hypothetical protein